MSDTESKPQTTSTSGNNKRFLVRDMVPFEYAIVRSGQSHAISVRSNPGRGEALIERIIMHRSIATKLILESIFIGSTLRGRRGSASCEAFLVEAVPNWTPDGIIIDEKTPLILNVMNLTQVDLKIVGQCIVRCREQS